MLWEEVKKGTGEKLIINRLLRTLEPRLTGGYHLQADVFLAPQIAVADRRFKIDRYAPNSPQFDALL